MAFLAATACPAALAQETYPSRPVTVIVPFPPGGFADVAMRALQPALERALRQPVVVQNRSGAAGAIGTVAVLQAKPDGYTVLFTLSSIATLPEQAEVNNQKPLFSLDQLVPIARVSSDSFALLVRADSPYKTVADLIAAAKARPGYVTYASSGNYGASHVPVAMLADAAGVKFTHVPFTGGGPMISAVLSGQVDFAALARSLASSQVQAGKMRYLVSFGQARWPNSDTPSLGDYGLRVEYNLWTGAFVAKNTPDDVVSILRNAFRTAVNDPEFHSAAVKAGDTNPFLEGSELQQFWRTEVRNLNGAVRKIGKLE